MTFKRRLEKGEGIKLSKGIFQEKGKVKIKVLNCEDTGIFEEYHGGSARLEQSEQGGKQNKKKSRANRILEAEVDGIEPCIRGLRLLTLNWETSY